MHCNLSVHGFTLRQVLNDATLLRVDRDLDVLEVFSGVGTVCAAAAAKGLQAASYDKNDNPKEDCLSKDGFRALLILVFRLKPESMLGVAPAQVLTIQF